MLFVGMHKAHVINMPRAKFTNEIKGEVRAYLDLQWPFSRIISALKDKNISISRTTISRIENQDKSGLNNAPLRARKRPGIAFKLNKKDLKHLKALITQENPPSQRLLAKKFGVSQSTINGYITKIFDLKCLKKPKVHSLSPKAIDNRAKRSFALYRELNNNKWQKFLTTDEAFITLDNLNRPSEFQYLDKDKKRADASKYSQKKSFPAKILVSVGMSARGITRPIFIDLGAKINAQYYITKVLPHYIEEMERLYPEGGCIFQQDSAPSHVAKVTLDFLRENKIDYLKPQEWLTNSPDAAPCDYFLWGYLRSQLKHRRAKTINGLKKDIKDEIEKIPLDMIQRALSEWPKRVYAIYKAKGLQIEN